MADTGRPSRCDRSRCDHRCRVIRSRRHPSVGRNVCHDPVDPAPRVRIIDDEREAGRPLGRRGPGERRRDVVAVARVAARDRAAVLEGAAGDRHRVGHWRSLLRWARRAAHEGGRHQHPAQHSVVPRPGSPACRHSIAGHWPDGCAAARPTVTSYMIPTTCPSGSAKRAIVVSGATSVSGMITLPPSSSTLRRVPAGSSAWT